MTSKRENKDFKSSFYVQAIAKERKIHFIVTFLFLNKENKKTRLKNFICSFLLKIDTKIQGPSSRSQRTF